MLKTKKRKITELKYKIISLLDNLPPQKRTVSFISVKTDTSENTIRKHLKMLEINEIITIGITQKNKRNYFLKEKFRKKIPESFEVALVGK